MKFSRKASYHQKKKNIWCGKTEILCSSVVVGVHMISANEPNSFIDDTIKLTAFNNNDDHFQNT